MLRQIFISGLFAGLYAHAVSSARIHKQDIKQKFGPLRFSDDGTFQLSIFEDLHFGEEDAQDDQTLKVINSVLDDEDVDFVVMNGDLLDRASTFRENRTDYIDKLVQPFVQRDLTWGSTYGNHDHTVNTSAKLILQTEQKYRNCRTEQMVFGRESGVGNYYIPVYPPKCKRHDCAPELLLWFFDSRGGFYYGQHKDDGSFVEQPNWVDESVMRWFKKTNKKLVKKFKKVIPSLAFTHIPTNASKALQLQVGVSANNQPGINDAKTMGQQSTGFCSNGRYDKANCTYGGQDVHLMQAVANTPGLMALFNAHEHGNTWCYKWDTLVPGMKIGGNGVNLCYGQHTGYGGNGDWIRGARQVLINQSDLANLEVKTWIRLETGNVVGAVSLNATYNDDVYPVTPNDKTYL